MMEQMQIGPAGGNGGKPFDHYDVPADARLTAIHVFTEWVLNAIQFDYAAADGQPGGRPPVGGLGGEHHVFYLDEDEYLIGISGRAGWYVDSVRFHTNKRVSAVYGGTGGDRDFSFLAPEGYEVGGLFGRSAWYVDALGIMARRRAASERAAAVNVVADLSADDIAAADMAAASMAAEGITEGKTGVRDLSADDIAAADMDAADMAADEMDDDEPWFELSDAGQQVTASVVVRREVIATQEELDALEEAALAEVIAVIEGDEGDEGTVDVAVYTQVMDDEATGQTVAVVMAVAAEAGDGIEVVGDQPDEVAVMVTDAINGEEDIDALEEEAIDGAIATLLESADDEIAEVDVTIYAGTSEDDSGQAYAAVVAIAGRAGTPAAPREPVPTRATPAAAAHAPRSKDLELVEGIGPKIAELLINHDIHDLADLAAAPVERLREILGAAGRRFRLADPTTWPEQARLGASGAWDALTELQNKLKAGRS